MNHTIYPDYIKINITPNFLEGVTDTLHTIKLWKHNTDMKMVIQGVTEKTPC